MAKRQKNVFKSGNQMAAQAAQDINYHVMGYYPISPSTEIAQTLDMSFAAGKHDIQLIAADGEHGAAGICYGAAVSGARVFNATSANGLMYMLEQLPVQSGTRYPMVMNLVNRTVSGPLNIHCDHSDMYFAMNSGWIMLGGANPQQVYDLNIIALKLAELENVQLPAMVNYDGYITSHQKHNVEVFADSEDVRAYIGPKVQTEGKYINNLDMPISVGSHMKGDELMNNRYQLVEAHKEALKAFDVVAAEYAEISGRSYGAIETYMLEDAETALFILNSSFDIAKDAVDEMRAAGKKVGLIKPTLIRPFPRAAVAEALRSLKSVILMDRADSPGAENANISGDVHSVINEYGLQVKTATRIYGLGGKEFFARDAKELLETGLDIATRGTVEVPFDYHGVNAGDERADMIQRQVLPVDRSKFKTGKFVTRYDEKNKKLKVRIPAMRDLMGKPKRFASGHGACPGCGIFSGLELFFKGIEGDVIILNHTGCGYVVSAGYPFAAHNQNYIHNLFQSGPATLSGMVEAIHELRDRGEIEFDEDATFVMMSGDGGMDIGMGSAIGTALRGHGLIMVEYDNEGYMNTGAQMSYSTPLGHRTSTTNVGVKEVGKRYQHKDTAQIMAATNIPYVFTAVEAFTNDIVTKAAKAQWYAKNVGPVYGKILISCPLNWKSDEKEGTTILEKAVNSNFFPLYEVEQGITTLTHDPEAKGTKIEASEWLKMMGKSKHLLAEENKDVYDMFVAEVERRFNQLKAKHESPYL